MYQIINGIWVEIGNNKRAKAGYEMRMKEGQVFVLKKVKRHKSKMRACEKCLENNWKYEYIEGYVRAECECCGYEVEFKAK